MKYQRRSLPDLIRGVTCKHHWVLIGQFYGDIINTVDARSEWQCQRCRKIRLSQVLWGIY